MLPMIIWITLILILGRGLVALLKKNQGTILLTGQTEAGKDTLLHILKDEGFSQEYRATPMQTSDDEVSSEKLDYTIINISGNKDFNNEKEKIKKELKELKEKEHERDIIYVYIFNILEFKKDDKLIVAEIKNAIKESKSRDFRTKIIASRGDRISYQEKIDLENRIKQIGADFAIFDMTNISKKEAFDFLERSWYGISNNTRKE